MRTRKESFIITRIDRTLKENTKQRPATMMHPTDEERVSLQQCNQQPSLSHRFVKRKDFLQNCVQEPLNRSHNDSSSILKGTNTKYSHRPKKEKQHIRHRSLPSPHSMLDLIHLESSIHQSRQRRNINTFFVVLALLIGLAGMECYTSRSNNAKPSMPNEAMRRTMLVAIIDEQVIDRPKGQPQAGLRGSMVSRAGRKTLTGFPIRHNDPPKSRKANYSQSRSTENQSIPPQKKKPNQNDHNNGKKDDPTKTAKNENFQGSDSTPLQKVMKVAKPTGSINCLLPPSRFYKVDRKVDRNLYSVNHKVQADEAQHRAPQTFFLDETWSMANRSKVRQVQVYPASFTDNTQWYGLLDSEDDEELSHMEIREPYVQGECVPMQEWQTTFHPSCNNMHELGLSERVLNKELDETGSIVGTKGFWRHAWRLNFVGGGKVMNNGESAVLKTLKLAHNFEDAHFEHDRIDAVAMERLTSSPHVVNAFAFCGHSVLTDFADRQRLGSVADKAKKIPLARIKIAGDIASGLADVHGIDGDGNATFVHLDINPSNILSVGGTLKLNDFNIGHFMRWNTTSNTKCSFSNSRYPNPQWRSPEEAKEEFLTEKVDVFSMGHIFYRLICGHEPWNKLEPNGKPSKEIIHQKVIKGVLPFIPDKVVRTKNKEVSAIRDAMLRCYTYDPNDRPSAREIANYLNEIITKLE